MDHKPIESFIMSPSDGDRRRRRRGHLQILISTNNRFSCPMRVISPHEMITHPECAQPAGDTRGKGMIPSASGRTCTVSFYRYASSHHLLASSLMFYTVTCTLLLLLQVIECASVSDPANNRSAELHATPPTGTQHHHHSHSIHLSKLLFPLSSLSFTSKSFNPSTINPKNQLFGTNLTSGSSPPRYAIGRKRKRESFALTISEEQPLKTLGSNAFWAETATPPRRRRVTSSLALHSKQKPFSAAAMGPLASLPSAGMASSVSGGNAAAAAGNMRMKIMMNPLGTGFVPDQKCNFEIYPSGCFDENGSICDTTGSGMCVCRPGYSIRTGSVYCLRPASIGEACYTTEQCERKVLHSGCFNYREEYREENPSAFFGPSQSSWPMGECRCRIGHRYDEEAKACVRSLIGSWCSNVWDCEMVEGDGMQKGGERHEEPSSGHRTYANLTRTNQANPMHAWHSPGHGHNPVSRAKLANIVCEHNICNCSQFFHFNSSAEECQFVETFGQSCRPNPDGLHPKRNTRSRSSSLSNSSPRHRQSAYHTRQLQSLPEDELISCNLPTICTVNGTCSCMEGFEHQPTQVPQCQPINKGVGGHITHYFHSGSSGSEGKSNVADFVEYVLYVLVPALVVIFMFKPCFRRIGEWRNHIHQYSSDSDFYLAANGLPPVITEVNVVAPGLVEKGVPGTQFAPFLPHMGLPCHNAYIFESADGCYAYGAGCLNPNPSNDPSLALVREKLQTIEETQSEEGNLDQQCASCAVSNPCCTEISALNSNRTESSLTTEDELLNGNKEDKRMLETKANGIELTQFNKPDSPTLPRREEATQPENAESSA